MAEKNAYIGLPIDISNAANSRGWTGNFSKTRGYYQDSHCTLQGDVWVSNNGKSKWECFLFSQKHSLHQILMELAGHLSTIKDSLMKAYSWRLETGLSSIREVWYFTLFHAHPLRSVCLPHKRGISLQTEKHIRSPLDAKIWNAKVYKLLCSKCDKLTWKHILNTF